MLRPRKIDNVAVLCISIAPVLIYVVSCRDKGNFGLITEGTKY